MFQAAVVAAVLAGSVVVTPSAATPLDAVLDVPRDNVTSEHAGGVASALPTDVAILGGLLDRARSDGVAPERYSALLHQYWLAVAANEAGLDLNAWDPQAGLAANERNLAATFSYYQRLALGHPDFLWTGQGGMAGPSFAAGIMDVDLGRVVLDVHAARDAIHHIVATLDAATAPATAHLPGDVRAVLAVGADITAEDIAWFQIQVIAMSKHIFTDLIPQHEAYLAGGLAAIAEMHEARLIDDRALAAWQLVDSGEPDAVVLGNQELLHREQYTSIGDQWDAAANYRGGEEDRGPIGRALTYLSTVAADPAVPGAIPPREASPLTLTAADVTGEELPGPTWRLQTPLSAFNWADRDDRWRYITERMVPAYRWTKENSPEQWRAAMSVPIDQQILSQRAMLRLPAVLQSVARTTKLTYE
ncbi:hypothetical protein [Rhodococcus rhodnii]|uniref:Tat pathway signal protein n=2 Tax=Rhodococcus rhodnii TaxID=38312 RepID=R7WR34_9NOCA|nr:hypothetical protein [Rhodococcus rhodnii]EOM77755.1 hypothetical protein Rrhod_0908 [Rhodococcus rhodnii LMG 5362]